MNAWVKIVRGSWHVESGLVSRGGMIHTLCGRWAPKGSLTSPFLKLGDRSCESCLRLKAVADPPPSE